MGKRKNNSIRPNIPADLRIGITKTKKPRTKKSKKPRTIMPPLWQMYYKNEIWRLHQACNACTGYQAVRVIDGHNTSSANERSRRPTIIVVSFDGLKRWSRYYGDRAIFFLIAPNAKEEDALMGELLAGLRDIVVFGESGDMKKGPIPDGGTEAAIRGCRMTFFSRQKNSPSPKNMRVQKYHAKLRRKVDNASNKGRLNFEGFAEATPTCVPSPRA